MPEGSRELVGLVRGFRIDFDQTGCPVIRMPAAIRTAAVVRMAAAIRTSAVISMAAVIRTSAVVRIAAAIRTSAVVRMAAVIRTLASILQHRWTGVARATCINGDAASYGDARAPG